MTAMAPTLSPEKKALLEQRLGMAAKKLVKGLVIPRRPNQHAAPLSFAQRQMWVIDQMTPGNPDGGPRQEWIDKKDGLPGEMVNDPTA